jgi:hypothetical protein
MSSTAEAPHPELCSAPPSITPSATLQPPAIHFPPLPRVAQRAAPVVRAPQPLVRPRSPFVGWAPHKGFRYPYPPGVLPSAASKPIKTIVSWGSGAIDTLPQQLASELGLDPFNYQIQLRMPPDEEQTRDLKSYLLVWAISAPESLLTHLFHETLDTVLGEKFPWAVFGKAKTLSRNNRLPW